MKNIHVLPTDKPSRLHKYNFEGFALSKEALNWKETYNIYITSDEEIKFNDYITDGYKVWKWKDDSSLLGRKKIILTTDQDLIKDGVQAIDDEFLELFVKNPSCEEVEVKHYNNKCRGECGICDNTCGNWYKIIIPKEEPKQLNSEDFGLPKIGTKEFNDLASALFGGKPKQETLEEVAERLFPNKMEEYEIFLMGAKWQQKNSNINALDFEIDSLKREIKVLKHQQERSYSEEDLISLLEFNYKKETNQLGTLRKDYSQKIVREWFEQFKKK